MLCRMIMVAFCGMESSWIVALYSSSIMQEQSCHLSEKRRRYAGNTSNGGLCCLAQHAVPEPCILHVGASKALLRCSSHYSVSSSWNFLLSFASCSSIPLLCHYVLRWIYYAFTIHQKWVYCSQLIRIPQRIRACDKNSEHMHGIQFELVLYGENVVVISERDGIIEPKHAGSAWNVQMEVPEEEHHNETREAQNTYV